MIEQEDKEFEEDVKRRWRHQEKKRRKKQRHNLIKWQIEKIDKLHPKKKKKVLEKLQKRRE